MPPPRRVSAGAHTNVPRWPHEPPPIDAIATTRSVVVIDADVPPGWRADDVRRLAPWPKADDAEYARVADDLAVSSRVGVRIGVAGPEADVFLLRRHLLFAGFVEGELTLHATSTDEIRLRCAHCGRVSRARIRPGELGRCELCRYDLVVHPHFSPRHAAFLGLRADAEDPR